MRIYITRHGETEWNKEGRMQGWKNSNLTAKGIDNARKLGKSLKHIDFDHVYCSPLGRAMETARCIIGEKNTEITVKDSLKEMGFGCWEGMEHNLIEKLYPEEKHNFWNNPLLYKPVDGESYEELIDRVDKTMKDIISSSEGENVLIVTHAAVLKAIYTIMGNHSVEEFWGPPYMYDTCLTMYEIKDGQTRCIIEADTSHLEEQPDNI